MGIAFDDSGDLFVAESGRHHLLLVSPDEAVEVYASQCHGRRFSGPRDLCFTHEGGVLFCDTGTGPDRGSLFPLRPQRRGRAAGRRPRLSGGVGTARRCHDPCSWRNRVPGGSSASSWRRTEAPATARVFRRTERRQPRLPAARFARRVGWWARKDSESVSSIPDGAVTGSLEVPGGNPTGMTFGGNRLRPALRRRGLRRRLPPAARRARATAVCRTPLRLADPWPARKNGGSAGKRAAPDEFLQPLLRTIPAGSPPGASILSAVPAPLRRIPAQGAPADDGEEPGEQLRGMTPHPDGLGRQRIGDRQPAPAADGGRNQLRGLRGAL